MFRSLALLLLVSFSVPVHAFFFIIPLPSTGVPPQMQRVIDALGQSSETKALAYVSEDKIFGSKYWVWGHYAGKVTQEEANRRALATCEQGLARAKQQTAGDQPLYDFGKKRCELYDFAAVTPNPNDPKVGPNAPAPAIQAAPAQVAPPVAATPAPAAPALAAPLQNSPVQKSPAPPDGGVMQVNGMDTDSRSARRLKELKALFDQGLITKEEYEEKRKVVLKDL